jgi:hypothetical protein
MGKEKNRLKVKGWNKIFSVSGAQKQTGVVILRPDESDRVQAKLS